MKKTMLIFWVAQLLTIISYTQPTLTQSELADYTSRAKNQIKVFLENVPVIASGRASKQVREAGVRSTLKIFSKNASIYEQNKFSKKQKEWKPAEYLNILTNRSETAPILIDFEVYDDLTPKKIKTRRDENGNLVYYGKMKFRQYYCKLKEGRSYQEPMPAEPNINCAYSDTTDKVVTFELSMQETIMGKFWVTKIVSIEVLRVY